MVCGLRFIVVMVWELQAPGCEPRFEDQMMFKSALHECTRRCDGRSRMQLEAART